MPPRNGAQIRLAHDVEDRLRDVCEATHESLATASDRLLRQALGMIEGRAPQRSGAPQISAPRRTRAPYPAMGGYVDPKQCRHPVNRRIGGACAVCGTAVRAGS